MSRYSDPVTEAITYLDTQHDGVSTFGQVPATRPARFRVVTRTGTEWLNPGNRLAQLTFECWNTRGTAAADDDGELLSDMLAEWEAIPAADGWVGGPYQQVDPDTGCPRSVITILIMQHVKQK